MSCTAREVFDFVSDIRNFRQFIPDGAITDWHSDRDTCSFKVSMAGTVNVRLTLGSHIQGRIQWGCP